MIINDMKKNDNKPEISIIVPVYQVEPYLPGCVQSILQQTFSDWELLLVDDGSTDKSGDLCDKFASGDSRIRVFHQENRGLSAARNKGLEHALGKYITMLDSDDIFMFSEYLATHRKLLEENNAQMTICGFCETKADISVRALLKPAQALMIVDGEELTKMRRLPASCYYGHAGAKLYKRELFEKNRFPVGRYVEDNAIAHRIIFPCERIAIIDTPMYGYRIRPDGIMGSTKKDLLRRDVIFAFQDRINYFNELDRPDLAHWAEQQMIRHLALYK